MTHSFTLTQPRHLVGDAGGLPVYRLGNWNTYVVDDHGDFEVEDKVEALAHAEAVAGRSLAGDLYLD